MVLESVCGTLWVPARLQPGLGNREYGLKHLLAHHWLGGAGNGVAEGGQGYRGERVVLQRAGGAVTATRESRAR